MRSNRALAPAVLLGVTLAALAAGAWSFLLRGSQPAPIPDSAAASSADRGSEPAPVSTGETATSLEPERGSARLAPVSRVAAYDLARRGRSIFYGRVTTPAGAPCEGATVCYDVTALATTGADGEYRIEVSHRPVAIVDVRPRFAPLAAIRPGVGAVVVEPPPAQRPR